MTAIDRETLRQIIALQRQEQGRFIPESTLSRAHAMRLAALERILRDDDSIGVDAALIEAEARGAIWLCTSRLIARISTAMADEIFDEPPPDIRLCVCGCSEREHDESGPCLYCGPEDCGGFTDDEDAAWG